jgi:hypothetical protein
MDLEIFTLQHKRRLWQFLLTGTMGPTPSSRARTRVEPTRLRNPPNPEAGCGLRVKMLGETVSRWVSLQHH